MEANHKRVLKALVLELRHMFEGYYDDDGMWHAGDLERRLNALGVWREREPLAADELAQLTPSDREARRVVGAYLKLRQESDVPRAEAVGEFVRETAYTWANRLLALRCMEARELIDEVILQKPVYGGRSLEHNRLAQQRPELCATEDDGLFAMLDASFLKQAGHLPLLFDPRASGVALKPSVAALKQSLALLSGTEAVRGQEPATSEIFRAPDAFGWTYQYWNTEEKERVFEKVRTQKKAKIEGADIISATQLYTEPYMVKFLVQNSLGATWVDMHPQTQLSEHWEYFVKDADRTPVEKKPVREITFLDPACGSGHFLLEAFDLFYAMYEEEGDVTGPEAIGRSILDHNLYGIDIDERAIQITEAALWMKAAERVPYTAGSTSFTAVPANLVATNIRLPSGKDHLKTFLAKYPESKDLSSALEIVFAGLKNANELGALLQIERPVEAKLRELEAQVHCAIHSGVQPDLYKPTPIQGQLPVGVESYDEWKRTTLGRLKQHFAEESEVADWGEAFFTRSAGKGLRLFDLLARRYDAVAANPPYLGIKKQGDVLKDYLDGHYSTAKYDLYAAFILRVWDLLINQGAAGLVTRSTWLFQKWYTSLRETALDGGWLRIAVALGSGAFEDFGGDVVDVTMAILSRTPNQHILGALMQDSNRKAAKLRSLCGTDSSFTQRPASIFRSIPGCVINFEITPEMVDVFRRRKPLKEYALVTDSVVVVARFLRFWWECPRASTDRWMHYSKGGSVERWLGFELFSLDWGRCGVRLKSYVLARYPASKFRLIVKEESTIGRPGLTWTTHASGVFGVRRIGRNYIVSSKGPGIFADAELADPLLGLLNSSVTGYLLRLISPGQEFGYKYVAEVPVPEINGQIKATLASCAEACVNAKSALVGRRMPELSFDPKSTWCRSASLGQCALSAEVRRLEIELNLLRAEYDVEKVALAAYELSADSEAIIYNRAGLQSWSMPDAAVTPPKAQDILAAYTDVSDTSGNSTAADEAVADEAAELQEEDDGEATARTRSTQDTTLGAISVAVGIHPIACYSVIRSALLAGEIQSSAVFKAVSDYFSCKVLELLEHQWPSHRQAGEPVDQCAEADAIIPVTGGTTPTVLDRVRRCISGEFEGSQVQAIEREFADLLGLSLEQWLTRRFFGQHTRQFKKRPVAWQLQSSAFSARGEPTFACFLSYQEVTVKTLTTIQSQFVRPLRQRYESEMRGLESVPQNARSERQQERLTELRAAIPELRGFDEALESLSRTAFGPANLCPALRQYAIEDAMLCLKSRWLDKLSGALSAVRAKEWQQKANDTGLHPLLPHWIADAIVTLRHHCSAVGPEAPKETTLKADPTAAELAVLISKEADEMMRGALLLACSVWWRPLDEALFAPLRKLIKDARGELKVLKDEDPAKAVKPFSRRKEIDARTKELRKSVKNWQRDLDEKTQKANDLREQILTWRCPEAATWECWLAAQPMYDALSSLDGIRQPPNTVAEFISQESMYAPDINDGVRVNIAPLQKACLLPAEVLARKDVDQAIADRAEWRSDERRWCREGKLPQPGWWPTEKKYASGQD